MHDNGYGRPPLHSRFKPGQSGNPSGRPSFKSEIADELAEVISIGKDHGVRMTKRRAIVKKLVELAIAGNSRVAIDLIALCTKLFREVDATDARAADDEAFVEKLVGREKEVADEKSLIPPSGEQNNE